MDFVIQPRVVDHPDIGGYFAMAVGSFDPSVIEGTLWLCVTRWLFRSPRRHHIRLCVAGHWKAFNSLLLFVFVVLTPVEQTWAFNFCTPGYLKPCGNQAVGERVCE